MPNRLPLIYVGDYSGVGSDSSGGLSAPEWASDSYTTPAAPATVEDPVPVKGQTTFAGYVTPPGQKIGRFYYCDDKGRIWEEDTTATVPFEGVALIVPAHLHGGDVGGAETEGKSLVKVWSYVVSEDSSWTFRLWPGGEYAFQADQTLNQPLTVTPAGFSNYAVPGYVDNVAASRLEQFPIDYNGVAGRRVRWQPKTVHHHKTDGSPRSGRGFIFEYRFENPVNVEFIGLGGVYVAGTASRMIFLVESE
jgi:hypothetical protein